jgi:hypothetical protein
MRPLPLVLVAVVLPLTSTPASAQFDDRWLGTILQVVEAAIEGRDVYDIAFPADSRICEDSLLDHTLMLAFIDELNQRSAARCSTELDGSPTGCDAGSSEIYFDLDDPVVGCSTGTCSWTAFAAPGGEVPCNESRCSMVISNTFPPAEPQLVTAAAGGAPVVVVAEGDPLPLPGNPTATNVLASATDGEHVVFSATATGGHSGLFFWEIGGGLSVLFDDGDPRPRSPGNFTAATSIDLRRTGSGTEVIWADGAGIYVAPLDLSTAPVQPVATGDPYATGRTVKGSFDEVGFWPGTDRIVFRAASHFFAYGTFSVSRAAPAMIARHADNETPIPGGTGNFVNCQRPSGRDDLVLFECFGPTGLLGLYADPTVAEGGVEIAALKGDSISGPGPGPSKVIASIATHRHSLIRRDEASVLTYFTDGSSDMVRLRRVLFAADFEENDLLEWTVHLP